MVHHVILIDLQAIITSGAVEALVTVLMESRTEISVLGEVTAALAVLTDEGKHWDMQGNLLPQCKDLNHHFLFIYPLDWIP